MTTAEILRAAANLIASGDSEDAGDAILRAAPPGEAVPAIHALAAHLNYATANPRRDLNRWSRMRSRDVIVREIRAAAHTEGSR